jgi:hypothetical protein
MANKHKILAGPAKGSYAQYYTAEAVNLFKNDLDKLIKLRDAFDVNSQLICIREINARYGAYCKILLDDYGIVLSELGFLQSIPSHYQAAVVMLRTIAV